MQMKEVVPRNPFKISRLQRLDMIIAQVECARNAQGRFTVLIYDEETKQNFKVDRRMSLTFEYARFAMVRQEEELKRTETQLVDNILSKILNP